MNKYIDTYVRNNFINLLHTVWVIQYRCVARDAGQLCVISFTNCVRNKDNKSESYFYRVCNINDK